MDTPAVRCDVNRSERVVSGRKAIDRRVIRKREPDDAPWYLWVNSLQLQACWWLTDTRRAIGSRLLHDDPAAILKLQVKPLHRLNGTCEQTGLRIRGRWATDTGLDNREGSSGNCH